MNIPREHCSWYLRQAFVDLKSNLKKAQRLLKATELEFDVIACRGVSGIVFASPLALLLNKPLIVVRKEGDGSHSENAVECGAKWDTINRWLFVDDFVSSGATMISVIKAISTINPKMVCAGRFLYSRMEVQEAEGGVRIAEMENGKIKKYARLRC